MRAEIVSFSFALCVARKSSCSFFFQEFLSSVVDTVLFSKAPVHPRRPSKTLSFGRRVQFEFVVFVVVVPVNERAVQILANFPRFPPQISADAVPFGGAELLPIYNWSVCTRGGGRGNNSAKLRGMRGGGVAILAVPYDGQRLV